jgi:hypothetical protein
MDTLIEASKIHKNPAAIHSTGECGTRNKATELRMAPIKK